MKKYDEAISVAEEQIRHWKYWDVSARTASVALGYTTHRRGWERVRKALVRWWREYGEA
jgi:hypothetical protein